MLIKVKVRLPPRSILLRRADNTQTLTGKEVRLSDANPRR
jgi:hypothetical protein